MDVPCNGCTDRRVGCHAECPAYTEYRAFREHRRNERQKSYVVSDYITDSVTKSLRGQKYRRVVRIDRDKRG